MHRQNIYHISGACSRAPVQQQHQQQQESGAQKVVAKVHARVRD